MKEFKINIKGRVKNFTLPENKSLIPLFEAVVNSLQAIEERRRIESFDGEISIKIEREETLSDEILGHIENITITDNGIGFNEDNFNSFLESDSDYKNEIGGKGVGRFSWLKAFKNVSIDSCFFYDGKYYKRAFEFALDISGINDEVVACDNTDVKTTVKLCSFLDKYKANSPVSIESIAIKLIQHCFVYFLNKACPQIILSDDKGNKVNLNEFFAEKIAVEKGTDIFIIGNNQFALTKIRVDGAIINSHKLYLCANSRLVEAKDLSKYIVNLDKALDVEEPFWCLGIITSKYLDNNVDMNRLSFTIPETAEDGFAPLVTMNKIVTKSVDLIEEYLSDYLKPIAEEKKKRIERYVSTQVPQYRHLLKYMSSEIEKIKPGVSDEKLDAISARSGF